jgi:N-acetylglutamate synthase-like GNAT family acetyltransferase
MILCAISYAKTLGFEKVYIVSDHINLYEKYGFKKIDEKDDYSGVLQSIFVKKI